LSPSLFDRGAQNITVNRLYHRVTDSGIRETALPVYKFRRFLFKYRIQPLIESAKCFNWIHGEKHLRLSGAGWKFIGEVAVKGDYRYVEKQLFSVGKKGEYFEWINAAGEVVAHESVPRNSEVRKEESMKGSGTDLAFAPSDIHEEPSRATLKIVKPLGKDELDLLITAWCVKIWNR